MLPKSFDEPWVERSYVSKNDLEKFTPLHFIQQVGDGEVVVYEHVYGIPNGKHPVKEYRMKLSQFCSGTFEKKTGHGYQVKSNYLGAEYNSIIKLIEPYLKKLVNIPTSSIEFTLRIAHAPWQFACHFDAADNIFIQLHGTRRVVLMSFDLGVRSLERYDVEPTIIDTDPVLKAGAREFILGPGDILFIPAGWFHYVESVGQDFLIACSTAFELPTKSYVEVNKQFDGCYAERNKIVHGGKELHHLVIK